jgi:hypothetical protein
VIPSLHEPHTHRLERSPTFPSLAPCATRLVTIEVGEEGADGSVVRSIVLHESRQAMAS